MKNKVLRKIWNALNANDYDAVRKYLEKDFKQLGYMDEYYFYLALISKDAVDKKNLYSKAIEYNPNFMDAYINRGLVNNELTDYESSLRDYNKAIELDSKCALAYSNRGYTKYKMQDYKGALEDYNKAILLNPKLNIAIDNKAKLLMEVCLEDDKEFSEKYYLSIGIQETNLGNFPEALSNFNEALKYNPKNDLIHFYKGVVYQNLRKNESAIDSYTEAININKNLIDAYYNRGQLLFNIDISRALDDFVTAVALDPKFIDAYYSIAVIQKNMGDYHAALKNLDKIIEIEPNAVNAKALKKLILQKYL